MNVMASTGLEEAYWFNAKPYIINASGSYTENLNTKQGRNKYVFYVKKSGAGGTTQINLDDIDGAGNNFPSQGRALIFYTDGNCSPLDPVVILRGGSDVFRPSYLGSNNQIILDEPWQVCEIHAVYDTAAGQNWWQVIRRTTEQRRNSYFQGIATQQQCTEPGCMTVEFDSVPYSYGISINGTTQIQFPYAGKWNVHFSGTAYNTFTDTNAALSLALNGNELQYATYTQHLKEKELYYSLSHHWLVNINDPTSDYLEVKYYSDKVSCLKPGDLIPETDCHEWPAAAINITYVGGGYGIDS